MSRLEVTNQTNICADKPKMKKTRVFLAVLGYHPIVNPHEFTPHRLTAPRYQKNI